MPLEYVHDTDMSRFDCGPGVLHHFPTFNLDEIKRYAIGIAPEWYRPTHFTARDVGTCGNEICISIVFLREKKKAETKQPAEHDSP